MSRRHKRTAAKYLVRRVIFVLLLLLLLALGAFGLWKLLDRGEEEEPSSRSSKPEPSSSSSRTEDDVQTGGGEIEPPESSLPPEESSQPESSQPQPVATDDGDWNLILINPTHAIEQEPAIEFDEVQGFKFDKRIAGKVRELIAAAKEDGYSLAIVSGYRTMDRSRVLYANKIAEYKNMGYDEATAKVEAAKWVAPPGTSEHHSGLAMDIVSGDYYTKYNDLVEAFENEPEAVWLRENCARFGFILRFPKDKVAVTGINYEPWHFRYVGVPHALIMEESGWTLEEYVAHLRRRPWGSDPLRYRGHGLDVAVSYLAASGGSETVWEPEEDLPFTLSGNNVDGFIITRWVGCLPSARGDLRRGEGRRLGAELVLRR